ncbi:MAG: hypothetical protein AAGF45_09565 [Pseudomonadota bacterium]
MNPSHPSGRADQLLARQSELLERALKALDERPQPTADAQATKRAFALLDRTMSALEAARADMGRNGQDPVALELLDRAISFAEQRDRDAAALQALLDRALDGIARLEAQVAQKDAELSRRTAALDELLTLSERSLSAATQREELARVGFWRRLFGVRNSEGTAR